MKVKVFLFLSVFVFLFAGKSSQAHVKECDQEICSFHPSSASPSQFFLDDVNELPDIDDLVAIPTDGKFWPVDGILTGHFGRWRGGRHHGHYHVGVDIAAPYGTSIVSPLQGVVSFVGRKGGYGLAIVIDHGNGISTLYGHNSKVMVREGDIIQKGQRISKIGSSGHSTGPHLHYEVRLEGQPVNPLAWTHKLQTVKI